MPFETGNPGDLDSYYLTTDEDVFDRAIELEGRNRISLEEKLVPAVIRPRVADRVNKPLSDAVDAAKGCNEN